MNEFINNSDGGEGGCVGGARTETRREEKIAREGGGGDGGETGGSDNRVSGDALRWAIGRCHRAARGALERTTHLRSIAVAVPPARTAHTRPFYNFLV